MTLIIQQICSIELSIKLFDLGLTKTKAGVFVWEYIDDSAYDAKFTPFAVQPTDRVKIYPAFTTNELIEMLPSCVDIKTNDPYSDYYMQVHKRTADDIKYIVRYVCTTFSAQEAITGNETYERLLHSTYAPKLPDALAEMLVFLLETKILNLQKD